MNIANDSYPFENLPLPYGYDALEPYIDAKTMHLHHDRHLQTYIDNLNQLLKNEPRLWQYTLEQLLYYKYMIPEKIRIPILRNAGGVFNHRFYFNGMSPRAVTEPVGKLGQLVQEQYGSYDNFKRAFKGAALSVFGSGYAWLVCDGRGLFILTTANQETPIEKGMCPIFTVDVWEHAYYLKHYNERAAYIDDWFMVNCWKKAEEAFLNCSSYYCQIRQMFP